MKKVFLLLLIIAFLLIPNVSAAEQNTLSLTDKDKKIVYNDSLFDENIFLYHTEMIPGTNYEDNLQIINKSNLKYDLYLKLFLENDLNYDLELMKNINFKIYLNDLLIFNGTIFDKNEDNALIWLGEYKNQNDQSNLKVITSLNSEYSNSDIKEDSVIHWEFVANYEDKFQTIEAPNTGITDTDLIIGCSLLVCSVILFGYLLKEDKKEGRKK